MKVQIRRHNISSPALCLIFCYLMFLIYTIQLTTNISKLSDCFISKETNLPNICWVHAKSLLKLEIPKNNGFNFIQCGISLSLMGLAKNVIGLQKNIAFIWTLVMCHVSWLFGFIKIPHLCILIWDSTRDIHIECSKQFKWS